MLVLDAAQTRAALPMTEAIESQVTAFSDDVEIPRRQQLGVSLFMPGRVGLHTGVKIVSTVPGEPQGVVIVVDPDGSPLGMVDGPTLTAIRTGAGSGLATRLMAPEGAGVLAMLGAGTMAFDQVEAVRSVRPIEEVLVWSRSHEKAEELADRVGGRIAPNPDEAVRGADVVSCATPAQAPLFHPDSVPARCHINAIGAFRPGMVEVPGATVLSSFVVVDDRDAAAAEAGDLLAVDRDPDATLAEVLGGVVDPTAPVTVFKSVGVASQDVAAALFALTRARDLGLGTEV